MLELSHEANTAYQVVADCIQTLQTLTIQSPSRSSDADLKVFSHSIRRSVSQLASAFDVFVGGVIHEIRRKGVFPIILPPYRVASLAAAGSSFQHINNNSFSNASNGVAAPDGHSSAVVPLPSIFNDKANALNGSQQRPMDPENVAGDSNTQPSFDEDEAKRNAAAPQQQQQTRPPNPAGGVVSSIPLSLRFGGASGAGGALATSSASCNAPNETVEGLVATGLYFLFETLVRQTLAREGALYLYQPQAAGATPNAAPVPVAMSSGMIAAATAAASASAPGSAALGRANGGAMTPATAGAAGGAGGGGGGLPAPSSLAAVPVVEEAQAVALFGGKPRPPTNVRLPLKTGVVGAVIRSGLAVNIVPEHATDSNPYTLCVPVFPVGPRTAPIGAVVLSRKAGNTPFSHEDEAIATHWAQLAAQLLTQYGVAVGRGCYFDPFRTLLKKTSPLQQYKRMGFSLAGHDSAPSVDAASPTDVATSSASTMSAAAPRNDATTLGNAHSGAGSGVDWNLKNGKSVSSSATDSTVAGAAGAATLLKSLLASAGMAGLAAPPIAASEQTSDKRDAKSTRWRPQPPPQPPQRHHNSQALAPQPPTATTSGGGASSARIGAYSGTSAANAIGGAAGAAGVAATAPALTGSSAANAGQSVFTAAGGLAALAASAGSAASMASFGSRLASLIAEHSTNQLVFRAVHHNHFATVRGSQLGGTNAGGSGASASSVTALQTQNVMDVADYVTNLEDCWKRTTDDLQVMTTEGVARQDDFREGKKKLKAAQQRSARLEVVCEQYKLRYEALRRELTVLCGAPVDIDSELHLGNEIAVIPPSTNGKLQESSSLRRTTKTIREPQMDGSAEEPEVRDDAEYASVALRQLKMRQPQPLGISTSRHVA